MRVSTASSGAEKWPQAPPIAVFIRNLKLLRLDLRPDWPGIVPSTLSDNQNNLRRRVQAVEWTLFYLFQLWDPELTRNKLQPFFPPLEPLQSSNLRAALFRSLSELTKNGTLGRERILRKAMLEECTGEKFDEILAEFSTIVLRKVVASSREYRTGAPPLSLPVSKRGPPSDTQNLLPMIIAYRASLHSMIDQKNELNSTCRDLKQFLHLKSNELANSRRMPKPLASELRYQQQIQDSINRSWHGDINWANTILNGDPQAVSEPLLEMDFSQVWSGMKKVEVKNDIGSPNHPDLLADLEDRLSKQKSRLQKWRKFKDSLELDSLRTRLQRSEHSKEPEVMPREQDSTIDPLAEHDEMQKTPTRSANIGINSMVPSEQEISYNTPDASPNPKTMTDTKPVQRKASVSHEASEATNLIKPGNSANISTEDLLAMQLGALSLEKDNNPELPETNPKIDDHPIIGDKSGIQDDGAQPQHDEDPASRAATLLERTRQSMLFVSAATPRPWKPIPENCRQSQLLLPGDPFETPEKRAENKEKPNAEATDEDPYSDYIDYDSVFKSRPKVAASPIPFESAQSKTPGEENQEEGCSLSELGLDSSPLGKVKTRPRAQTAIRHPISPEDNAETTY
ncbi:hypothetical protein A7C99_4533 [Trichophyton rubrum]|uniref:HAUS augmin-like complex subunit 6 N-terminal domain-containing protein n=4 Tax=Trichophyton TaxID=5550 RepID=A0A178EUV7_TRIRU|nr:hypothetical protein HL42_2987 [Trichophyton rubrum]OAL63882.1 hypothetical protein A7C99_4533 [Trichophyton rubrum]